MTDYRNITLYGDNRRILRELVDAQVKVNLGCTSPPYLNKRSYLPDNSPDKHLEIGDEKELQDYLDALLEVFGLVRELLYDDGSLWVVIADSHAGSGGAGGQTKKNQPKYRGASAVKGLKPKDLCLVPHRLAIAMQEAGWWVRCDVIWHKPSCLPPFAPDRPMIDHEYVWMFTKTKNAYYDQNAARGPVSKVKENHIHEACKAASVPGKSMDSLYTKGGYRFNPSGVCLRSVWSINPEPLKEEHYAAYPTKLASRIIRLASSERGHCPACGAGFKRIIEKGEPDEEHKRLCGADSSGEYHGQSQKNYLDAKAQDASATKARILEGMVTRRTVGWEPSCKCGLDPVPALVLDVFGGSGTTGQVAEKLGRDWLMIELNEAYRPLIEHRTQQRGLGI